MRTSLQRALAGTSLAAPRPLAGIDLPARAAHLLDRDALAGLAPAAVLVPVIDRPDALSVLFTVRGRGLRNHAGQISFPGGRCDAADADAVATALRESREEVALASEHVRVLGFLDDYPTVTGFRVTPVVGLVSDRARFRADGVEVVETFEAPLSLLADPGSYERHTLDYAGHRLPYYAVRFGRHFIWGATAGMLLGLAQLLDRH